MAGSVHLGRQHTCDMQGPLRLGPDDAQRPARARLACCATHAQPMTHGSLASVVAFSLLTVLFSSFFLRPNGPAGCICSGSRRGACFSWRRRWRDRWVSNCGGFCSVRVVQRCTLHSANGPNCEERPADPFQLQEVINCPD